MCSIVDLEQVVHSMSLPRSTRRQLSRLVLLAGVLATLAGCAVGAATPRASRPIPAPPSYRIVNGTKYVPVGTAEREYTAEASTLRLPAARTWQSHPLKSTDGGSPVWYQVGFGRQTADRYWFCGWAAVAAGTTHADVRRSAVATLQKMLHLYYYTTALAVPSRPQLVRELTSAQRGDLRELVNDLRLNC
jgi:hypothetical protein